MTTAHIQQVSNFIASIDKLIEQLLEALGSAHNVRQVFNQRLEAILEDSCPSTPDSTPTDSSYSSSDKMSADLTMEISLAASDEPEVESGHVSHTSLASSMCDGEGFIVKASTESVAQIVHMVRNCLRS